jgi:hypothetical protein
MMTFTSARFLFDAMNADQKDRVMRTFDLIRLETGFPNVRDAFVQAVDDEATATGKSTVSRLSGSVERDGPPTICGS